MSAQEALKRTSLKDTFKDLRHNNTQAITVSASPVYGTLDVLNRANASSRVNYSRVLSERITSPTATLYQRRRSKNVV